MKFETIIEQNKCVFVKKYYKNTAFKVWALSPHRRSARSRKVSNYNIVELQIYIVKKIVNIFD